MSADATLTETSASNQEIFNTSSHNWKISPEKPTSKHDHHHKTHLHYHQSYFHSGDTFTQLKINAGIQNALNCKSRKLGSVS